MWVGKLLNHVNFKNLHTYIHYGYKKCAAKCSTHAKILNSIRNKIIFPKTDVSYTYKNLVFRAHREIFRMTETKHQPLMAIHIGQIFYFAQTFSTFVPSQTITHCMWETVDNKGERNMTWVIFTISRFIPFKCDKVCR